MRWLTTFRFSWLDVWLMFMALIAWVDATETRAQLRRRPPPFTGEWTDMPAYRSKSTITILKPPYDWNQDHQ